MENAKIYTVEDMVKLTDFLDNHLLHSMIRFSGRYWYWTYRANPNDDNNNRRVGELAYFFLSDLEEFDKMYPEIANHFRDAHGPEIEHAKIIQSKGFF